MSSTIPQSRRRNLKVGQPPVRSTTTTPRSWIAETGGTGGGGGGTGVPAPPVTIGEHEVIFRSDHQVEVDVNWTAHPTATPQNFLGVYVYLEDPDISSGAANVPLGDSVAATDGMPLDGNTQVSGKLAPDFYNEATKSPAVLFPNGPRSYKVSRNIRVYLAAFGPSFHPSLVRATEPNPTPNVLITIPLGRGSGESGQECAFLITNPIVDVTTDYNRIDPQYVLTFKYTPPDPSIPVPPGMNHFGGCRIVFVDEDADGNPLFPGRDTGLNVPVNQADSGFNSPTWPGPDKAGKFRVYFISEDDAQPLGIHQNTLVEGTTPFAYAIVPAVPGTPDVSSFAISGQKVSWLVDGSMIAEALFTWNITDNIRYAGVYLYLVNVTGSGSTLTSFPQDLSGPQSNKAVNYPKDVSDIPKTPEVWTIAAISYNINGALADDPKKFGQPSFHSPTVTWNIGPPTPGSDGSGTEFAPLVVLAPGASASATQSLSSDGVGMVSFSVGSWVNPDDNQFGNAQVRMVVNHDTSHPTDWVVPGNATSFQSPSIPSFGNIGSPVDVDFYILSDDPQGNKNKIAFDKTPVIHYRYTPQAGAVIPARSGWFDENQFSWVPGAGGLHADNIEANNIFVGRTLVVGGATGNTFAGQENGQIAVKNASGQLRAWMGEQQADQGQQGAPLWGAWFGQIWIGGTNPLDAPLWIDNQGIIQVGGIAAAKGSRYPYLSVRDQTGLEMGRIGASLNQSSGSPGDNVGTNPPQQLTAGAWFTQLAVGGNNLSNWNVLIVPDTSAPLGSLFKMRNINLLSIDYPAQALVSPYNNEYTLEFGNSVWMAGGLTTGAWRFPGIHVYEMDGSGNNFGATFISRGTVLRGTRGQGYQVLASLVTFNGDSSGRDTPDDKFWGELAMYSPLSATRTVYLTSGGPNMGSPQFVMLDVNGNLNFQIDINGNTYVRGILQGAPSGGTATDVTAIGYKVFGYGEVIDSTGHWKGVPIVSGSSQTPWMQPIQGAGFPLSNAGNISAAQYLVNTSGNPVINSNGAFVGSGVDVGGYGIGCSYLTTRGRGGYDQIDTNFLNCSGHVDCAGVVTANGGYGGGSFRGAGVSCVGYGIGCSYLNLNGGTLDGVGNLNTNAVNTNSINSANGYTGGSFRGAGIDVGGNGITCGSLQVSNGPISCGSCTVNGTSNMISLQIRGVEKIDSNGIYRGGVQTTDHVYGGDYGISFVSAGWSGGFYDRDGVYHVVRGGIITNS